MQGAIFAAKVDNHRIDLRGVGVVGSACEASEQTPDIEVTPPAGMAFGRAPTHGCCTFRVSHGEDILLRAASRAILGASWRAERGWGRGDEPDKRIRQSPADGVGGLRGRDRLDRAGRASRPRVVSRCARPILRDLYFRGGAPRRPGRQIHRRCRRRRLRSADGARGRRAPRGEGRPRDSQRSSGSQRDPDARARNRVGCRRRCEHRRGVRGSRSAARSSIRPATRSTSPHACSKRRRAGKSSSASRLTGSSSRRFAPSPWDRWR